MCICLARLVFPECFPFPSIPPASSSPFDHPFYQLGSSLFSRRYTLPLCVCVGLSQSEGKEGRKTEESAAEVCSSSSIACSSSVAVVVVSLFHLFLSFHPPFVFLFLRRSSRRAPARELPLSKGAAYLRFPSRLIKSFMTRSSTTLSGFKMSRFAHPSLGQRGFVA